MRVSPLLACLLALALACGDDDGSTDVATQDMGPGGDLGSAPDAGPPRPPTRIGPEDRTAPVTLPLDYDEGGSYPLLVLLHGYSASGLLQGAYFGIPAMAREGRFIAVIPDGTPDSTGKQFWNATDACCDFGNTGVDDVAYIGGLIDEAIETYAVDPARVYLLGHSNGGFMSYRMACDASEKITAIASLAGATWGDPADCGDPAEPVSVLQIHGTLDDTIVYEGGTLGAITLPSARESVDRFADRAGCAADYTPLAPLDFDAELPGEETVREERVDGCAAGTQFALWSIEGGAHIPNLAEGAIDTVVDWLLAQTD